MKVLYKVKFQLYQYNSGKADNGYKVFEEEFETGREAKTFYYTLVNLEKNNTTSEFAERYCWSGFLHKILGLFKYVESEIIP